ncbi:MAG: hypothetical protein RR552_05010 [Oscillospiraceae bacterium]
MDYKVYDVNLNEGTSEGYVYLGYRTTIDKANAITDISLMDMEGGFSRMNYRESAEASAKNVGEIAADMLVMCKEFSDNYAKGSLPAMLSYQSLNTLYIPDINVLLGDYLLDLARTKYDLHEMILLCNSTILSCIYSYLMLGTQAPVTRYKVDKDFNLLEKIEQDDNAKVKNWVEVLEEELAKEEDLTDRADLYDVKATKILASVRDFSKNFKKAVNANQENKLVQPKIDSQEAKKEFTEKIDAIITEKPLEANTNDEAQPLYYACYELLEKYPNVINLLLKGEEIKATDLYKMVKALTPGQLNAVHMSTMLSTIPSAFMEEKAYNEGVKKLEELKKEIEYDRAYGDYKMSVYTGVNLTAYGEEVGITNEANRYMSSKGDYEAITHETTDHIRRLLNVALSISGVISGVVLLVSVMFPVAGFIATWVGATALAATCGSLATALAESFVFGVISWATLFLGVLLLLALLATYIYDWSTDGPSYTSIPKKMFDIKDTATLEYDVVLDQNGKPADINNKQGSKWNALYTTKDPDAGSPIKLPSQQADPFRCKLGDGTTPAGYEPITFFGEKVAVNMNRNAYYDEVGGIYLFYQVDGPLSSDIQHKEGKYLSDIFMFCEDTEAKAKFAAAKKEGNWCVHNYNLTQGLPYATFVAYKTTDNENLALRDIRVLSGINDKGYTWGDQSYSNNGHSGPKTVGSYDPISPGEYTLIATSNACAGSPILAEILTTNDPNTVPPGYEPVNSLGVGGFFDFNTQDKEPKSSQHTHSYLYFLPSKIFTAKDTKEEYLSGFYFIYDYLRVPEYSAGKYLEYYEKNLWTNSCTNGTLMRNSLIYTDEKILEKGSIVTYTKLYSTKTYNPYRAISDIRTYRTDNGKANFPKMMASMGKTYTACEVYSQEQIYDSLERTVVPSNNYRIIDDDLSLALYVSGADKVNKPIKVSDFVYKSAGGHAKLSNKLEGHDPVNSIVDRYSPYAENLYGYDFLKTNYMFIKREPKQKPKYIESLVLNYTATDKFADTYSRLNLASAGCDEIIDYNLNDENDPADRVGYLGIKHTNDLTRNNALVPITGIAMYYFEAPEDADVLDTVDKLDEISPGAKEELLPSKIIKNNIQYTRISGNGVYVGFKRWVFLYTTTAELAGEPITKIWFDDNPYAEGQSLSTGAESAPILSALADGFWFLHYQRTVVPQYISSIQIGVRSTKNTYYSRANNWFWGQASIDYDKYAQIDLLQKGMTTHENVDAVKDTNNYTTSVYADDMDISHVFFGHTRTTARKRAITGIVAHTNDVPEFVKNGITYTRIEGECNTHYAFGGRHQVLYVTKDIRAGSPIVDIAIDSNPSTGGSWNTLKYSWGSNCDLRVGSEDRQPKYLLYRRIDNTGDRILNVASVFFNAPISFIIGFTVAIVASGAGALLYRKYRRKEENLNKKEGV